MDGQGLAIVVWAMADLDCAAETLYDAVEGEARLQPETGLAAFWAALA